MRSAQCFATGVNHEHRIAARGISAIDDIARKNPGMAGGRAARSLSIYANSRQAFSLMNCLLEVAQTIAFCRLRSFLLRQATKNDGLSYCALPILTRIRVTAQCRHTLKSTWRSRWPSIPIQP